MCYVFTKPHFHGNNPMLQLVVLMVKLKPDSSYTGPTLFLSNFFKLHKYFRVDQDFSLIRVMIIVGVIMCKIFFCFLDTKTVTFYGTPFEVKFEAIPK